MSNTKNSRVAKFVIAGETATFERLLDFADAKKAKGTVYLPIVKANAVVDRASLAATQTRAEGLIPGTVVPAVFVTAIKSGFATGQGVESLRRSYNETAKAQRAALEAMKAVQQKHGF